MKKTGNLRDSSKLDPLIFSVFFSLLRKPAEHSSADCRFADLCERGRRSPAGAAAQQADCAAIERAKRAEKEPERRCASLLAASKFPALFHIACVKHLRTQNWFSRELEGGFYLKSRPSNVFLTPIFPACPSPSDALPDRNTAQKRGRRARKRYRAPARQPRG